uniref:hypothetical protein n=1 Tax=Halopiger djelfimassiliensis TaxID=1293047 RepID=UPI001E531C61|nr:hypothetical protein [Halopiger djelfimassiliensis]
MHPIPAGLEVRERIQPRRHVLAEPLEFGVESIVGLFEEPLIETVLVLRSALVQLHYWRSDGYCNRSRLRREVLAVNLGVDLDVLNRHFQQPRFKVSGGIVTDRQLHLVDRLVRREAFAAVLGNLRNRNR